MDRPRLSEINLNLLLALDAILTEKSVSRAARRVGVSQPAMSQSLRNLRDIFDDALLVRDRGAMVLTPAAERLIMPLRQAMIALQRVLDGPAHFDPATAQRCFTLAAGDYAAVTLLPPLLERASIEAPGVDIVVRPVEQRRVWEPLATGELDIALGAALEPGSDFLQQVLYTDGFACLARRDHPSVRGRLDIEQYASLPHALISPRGEGATVVDSALEALGKRRRIALRIPYFLAAPLVVARSDLLLTAPRLVAEAFAATHPLQLLEPPLALPTFDVVQIWHQRFQDDAAHQWLRRTIATCVPGGARAPAAAARDDLERPSRITSS
jgi:DNA-binding transcriptional LysR family regulator